MQENWKEACFNVEELRKTRNEFSTTKQIVRNEHGNDQLFSELCRHRFLDELRDVRAVVVCLRKGAPS